MQNSEKQKNDLEENIKTLKTNLFLSNSEKQKSEKEAQDQIAELIKKHSKVF